MKQLLFVGLYILITILVVQNQLLLAALLVLLFTYYKSAAWLIPLGFIIDGYFGAFATLPMFSMGAICWYVVSEFFKPRLRIEPA